MTIFFSFKKFFFKYSFEFEWCDEVMIIFFLVFFLFYFCVSWMVSYIHFIIFFVFFSFLLCVLLVVLVVMNGPLISRLEVVVLDAIVSKCYQFSTVWIVPQNNELFTISSGVCWREKSRKEKLHNLKIGVVYLYCQCSTTHTIWRINEFFVLFVVLYHCWIRQ